MAFIEAKFNFLQKFLFIFSLYQVDFKQKFLEKKEYDIPGTNTGNKLNNICITIDEDCSATRYICELVSRRAGFMAAAGITALLKKMDYKVIN